MRWIVVGAVVAVVGAGLAPLDAEAQRHRGRRGDDGALARRGSPGLSVEVGAGPTFVGLWAPLGERASLGVEAQLSWVRAEQDLPGGGETQQTQSRFGLGPSVKLYLDDGVVAPFVYGHVGLASLDRTVDDPGGEREIDGQELLARGALGAEWFASSRFSVAANVGVRWRSQDEDASEALGSGAEIQTRVWELFTSGLAVTFHF